MYIPAHFVETDVGVLHALIRSHPLGAWVTTAGEGLLVNHIPFVLDPARGEFGTLIGHVARANPVWRQYSREVASVVIFQGAEHYISPSWYRTKAETGKVVPTWNYAVVHAHGVPMVFEDGERLRSHVTSLTDANESAAEMPWHVSDAPADFVDALLPGIVGIEIPIASLAGKWKASQNRSEADREGVIHSLHARGDARAQAMADLIDHATGRRRNR